MYSGLHVIYPLFLSDFIETRIFSTYFPEIPNYKISRKFVQWETSNSMPTNGQTNIRADKHDEANKRLFAVLQKLLKTVDPTATVVRCL